MNNIRIRVITCALLLSALFAASAQAAVCPYTYVFELNGQHYYSACKCSPPSCLEISIDQLLIYNQQVQNTGCDVDKKKITTCKCETSLTPVGTILGVSDLKIQLGEHVRARITKDDFVVSQYQGYNIYFRTLTFTASSNEQGQPEERSIAIPLSPKKVTKLVTHGMSGKPVVFHETTFDGANVTFAGKNFASVVRNLQVKPVAQLSLISK